MNEPQATRFDVKHPNVTNWQNQDDMTVLFCQMTALAKTKDEWISLFSGPNLSPKVPEEIGKLIEVARSAMIYSWYYYPLATLGAEQCWRLLDLGTRLRCQQAGISTTFQKKNGDKGDTTFAENIDSLIKANVISASRKDEWAATRTLRNLSSHPDHRTIWDPGQAEGILTSVVACLNALFH